MAQLLMTGFPGFLGSALLPRLLARRPDTDAVCLVQPQHAVLARSRVKELEITDPHTMGRIRLTEGDITVPGLGLGAPSASASTTCARSGTSRPSTTSPSPQIARRVNVDGTTNVLDFCREQPHLRRLQYVSTCYVSGRHEGEFAEDALEVGQAFRNHYEETKYQAELIVRKAMADGIPATIYRPGIVVGDSQTGATQKYDGPYFLATFLARQPRSPWCRPWGMPTACGSASCRATSWWARWTSCRCSTPSAGRTYALVDPDPPTVREVVTTFARHRNTKVVWMPLPLAPVHAIVEHVPGMERLLGLPAEALDYFASPTTYATANTTRDLTASGLTCPPFTSYAGLLLDFMQAHPEYDANAMT